ncbi:MAG TPA: TolC family protein, partial [Vicinamibacterales bacterium]
ITAGALNNPIIYDRYAGGVTVNQLVTDFGRTHALVSSSSERAQAEEQNLVATRADVLLAVDQAYFALLRAQALLTVATQTVSQRQLLSDQVTTLQQNQIKSGLDVDFANVNLAQAKLLLIQAQNNVDAANASLSAALGYPDDRRFQLSDQPVLTAPPGDEGSSVQDALKNRPELIGQQLNATSAHSYASAEHDLKLPTVSAAAALGVTPSGAAALAPHYAAAGVNVNVPVFSGHLFGALEAEAQAQAKAADSILQDLQDRIVRDVRTAWLDANSAFQRLAVTDQLLASANQAVELAQSRYTLGLSSIIELSQAQLNQTQAQIDQTSARYDYQIALADLAYQTGALH